MGVDTFFLVFVTSFGNEPEVNKLKIVFLSFDKLLVIFGTRFEPRSTPRLIAAVLARFLYPRTNTMEIVKLVIYSKDKNLSKYLTKQSYKLDNQ